MTERSPQEQRLEMKDKLDKAMAAGELTIEALRAIPPTATSSEHHISLMKQLKSRERIEAQVSTIEAIAFLATKDALEELLYDESQAATA